MRFSCLFLFILYFLPAHAQIDKRRVVIYIDWKVSSWSDLGVDIKKAVDAGYNVIILSFYLENGPADAAIVWNSMTSSQRKSAISYANDRGAAVLVSAGGATFSLESAISKGTSYATSFCGEVASWVVSTGLNGVDFDMEATPGDSAPFRDGTAITWLAECSLAARKILGTSRLISHAPQAPYFGTWAGPSLGYTALYKTVPDTIDFFNIQFYNQGQGTYNSYETIFTYEADFPDTAIKEMINNGIPADKLVVGKPTKVSYASNGWVDACNLHKWGYQAYIEYGWNAGFMGWMWDTAPDTLMWAQILSTNKSETPADCNGNKRNSFKIAETQFDGIDLRSLNLTELLHTY